MKITEYPSITEFASDNVILTDGSAGTKKITMPNPPASPITCRTPATPKRR